MQEDEDGERGYDECVFNHALGFDGNLAGSFEYKNAPSRKGLQASGRSESECESESESEGESEGSYLG
jgi:hypothetical protein